MKLLVVIFLAVALAFTMGAATYTNIPSADAFVRAAAPASNYGGAGSEYVSGATATNGNGVANGVADTFMRFNTAAMVASFDSTFGGTNWLITSARLLVNEQGAPPNTIFTRGVGGFQ